MKVIRFIVSALTVVVIASSPAAHGEGNSELPRGPQEVAVDGNATATAIVREVTDAQELERIRNDLQRELIRLGSTGQLTDCDHVIEVDSIHEAGHDEGLAAGHDWSYGAACNLRLTSRNLQFFMCNDTMVGKFTMTSSGTPERRWLVRFIRENCPPGG
jgi:hypothetical protein